MLKSNIMKIIVCLTLLFTSFPQQTIAGRQFRPAGLLASIVHTSRLIQIPGAKREASREELEDHTLVDGIRPQDEDLVSHRKIPSEMTDPVNRNVEYTRRHRLLVGSSPPTCKGRCGRCIPCHPIHMTYGDPREALARQEYYPEVWRCKCGNRYFLP